MANNPYREVLMARPRTLRNLLANTLVGWACKVSGSHVGARAMSVAYEHGWRHSKRPNPTPSSHRS